MRIKFKINEGNICVYVQEVTTSHEVQGFKDSQRREKPMRSNLSIKGPEAKCSKAGHSSLSGDSTSVNNSNAHSLLSPHRDLYKAESQNASRIKIMPMRNIERLT